jgi:hypothetical protein
MDQMSRDAGRGTAQLAIALAAGALLALELLALRLLIPVVGSEGRTLSLAIAATLAGAALGTEAGRRLGERRRVASVALLAAGAWAALAPSILTLLAPALGDGLGGGLLLALVVVSPPAAFLALPYPLLATVGLDANAPAAGAASASIASNVGALVGGVAASLPIAGLLPTSVGLALVALVALATALLVWRIR